MPRRRRSTRKRWSFRRKVSIGATVTTVGSLVTLFFVFFPGLRPGTGGCSGTDGRLESVRAEPGETWRDYEDRLNNSIMDQSAKQLEEPGTIVTYRATLHGYKSSHLEIYWSVHRRASSRPVRDSLKNQLAFDFTPRSCDAEVGQPIFVPRVGGRGEVYVELRLDEVGGNELDSSDTAPFAAAS
jgi:hypothetical protein